MLQCLYKIFFFFSKWSSTSLKFIKFIGISENHSQYERSYLVWPSLHEKDMSCSSFIYWLMQLKHNQRLTVGVTFGYPVVVPGIQKTFSYCWCSNSKQLVESKLVKCNITWIIKLMIFSVIKQPVCKIFKLINMHFPSFFLHVSVLYISLL